MSAFAGCGDDGGGGADAAVVVPDATIDATTDAAPAAAIEWYEGEASAALGAEGNQSTCATCHSNDGTQPGFSGYSLKDIAYRESFKGGLAPDLLSAVNACVVEWMGGEALTAEDEGYLMLEQYMQSISVETETTPNQIAPEVLADVAAYEAAYAGGDGAAGEAAYTMACAKCHDAALQIGPVPSLAKEALASYPIGRIAQKVRTSGPIPSSEADAANQTDTTPGPMPFFEPGDLSSEDLANIIAYLRVN